MNTHKLSILKVHFLIIFFVSILVAMPSKVAAQMALPSMFPGEKSTNPAIISQRKYGNIRMMGQYENFKKLQHVKTLDSKTFQVDETARIDVKKGNFFRGGKGSGFTTELEIDSTSGDRESEFLDGSNKAASYNSYASSNYASFGFGTPYNLGFTGFYVDYKNKYTINNQVINNETFNDTQSMNTKIMGLRGGLAWGNPNASIGLITEYIKFKKSKDDGSPSGQKIIGAGVGIGNNYFHLEGGVELGLNLDPMKGSSSKNSSTIMKVNGILEIKFGDLKLGYKGTGYKGSYTDLNRIIQGQMVYGDIGKRVRLEHDFNFSLGKVNGIYIGGAANFFKSKGDEKSNIFTSSNRHETTSTGKSISLLLGYSY